MVDPICMFKLCLKLYEKSFLACVKNIYPWFTKFEFNNCFSFYLSSQGHTIFAKNHDTKRNKHVYTFVKTYPVIIVGYKYFLILFIVLLSEEFSIKRRWNVVKWFVYKLVVILNLFDISCKSYIIKNNHWNSVNFLSLIWWSLKEFLVKVWVF